MTKLSFRRNAPGPGKSYTQSMKRLPMMLAFAFAVSPVLAMEPAPKIDKEQATKAVVAAVPGGRVESAEHEHESGRDIWSFDVKTKEGMREVWIDDKTGAVVSNVLESPAEQGEEKILDKAEEMAKARISGEVLGSRLSKEGKRKVSFVTIKAKDGHVLVVTGDAQSGKILKVGAAPKEERGEKGESGEKDEKGEKGEHGGEHDEQD